MNFKEALDKLISGDDINRMERIAIGKPNWKSGCEQYNFSRTDMCSEDWVIIPKKIIITAADLKNAWERIELSEKSHVLTDLTKELGLT